MITIIGLREWCFLAATLLILLSLRAVVSGQTLGERVGPQLSHIPMNARTAALADASTALIDTYAGTLTNPSALGFMKMSWVDYTINWIRNGVFLQHAGLVFPTTAAGTFSVNLEYLFANGADLGGVPPFQADGSEFRLGVGYGYLLSEEFSIGLRLHLLRGQTAEGSGYDVLGEAGLTYSPGKYVTYAFTLGGLNSNYHSPISILPREVESSQVARVFGVGLVFDYPFYRSRDGILFSLASEIVLGQRYVIYKVGVEYKTFSLFRVRAGLKLRGTESEPRFGVGLVLDAFSFDYAYLYSRRDQASSYMLTAAVCVP